MLDVQPCRQSKAYCGPASLKMVLSYYGTEKSETSLARLAGARRNHGTPGRGLVKAAESLGFRASLHDEATLKGVREWLQAGVPVIVNWFSMDEGHYSVAVGMDRSKIHLIDPECGTLRSFPLKNFKRVWFDFPGDFLQDKQDMVIRRMIVVRPPHSSS